MRYENERRTFSHRHAVGCGILDAPPLGRTVLSVRDTVLIVQNKQNNIGINV